MGRETEIGWCDSTVNPTMGCAGCELWSDAEDGEKTCYAGILHDRYGGVNKGFSPKFNILTQYPGRMVGPDRHRQARQAVAQWTSPTHFRE